MKHNVASLEGALLDAAVRKVTGQNATKILAVLPKGTINSDGEEMTDYFVRYAPSTNWMFGGPLIRDEHISLVAPSGELKEWQAHCKYQLEYAPERLATRYGPTPLIAAMRAYVASKCGSEIELDAQ